MSKSENLTVMFTDIVGFTEKTSQLTREEHRNMLADHDGILIPLVKHFGGKRIKSVGDGMLVSFGSPTDAVKCAMAMHDQLYHYNEGKEGLDKLEIRTALNVGEVEVERNDIFGDAVNLASRLESVTPTGEVYFTQAVHLAMNQAEVNVENVGEQQFKGKEDTTTIYRVKINTTDGSAPPYGIDLSKYTQGVFSNLSNQAGSITHSNGFRKKAAIGIGVITLVACAFLFQSILKPAIEEGDDIQVKLENDKQQIATMLELKNLEQAELLVNTFITENPDDAGGLLLNGHVQSALGKVISALTSYDKAIEINPELITDPQLIQSIIERIGTQKEISEFIINHPEDVFLNQLSEISIQPGWNRRHDAVKALKNSNSESRIDWTLFYLMNLKEQTVCKDKLDTIKKLRKLNDERALSELVALENDSLLNKIKNLCYKNELTATIKQLSGDSQPEQKSSKKKTINTSINTEAQTK